MDDAKQAARSRLPVAGVSAPAFVERTKRPPPTSRPSTVAGVSAPAFVERRRFTRTSPRDTAVAGVSAPAFVERRRRGSATRSTAGNLSPGFRPRPSLSESQDGLAVAQELPAVAGVSAPAFVERQGIARSKGPSDTAVAGVSAPAFVERASRSRPPRGAPRRLSPGFRAPAFVERAISISE